MYPPSVILAARGLSTEAVSQITGVEELDAVPVRPAPGWMRAIWTRGTAALTLPWAIYVDPARLTDPGIGVLLLHELVHVRQWRRVGSVRFLWTYLRDYVSARRRGLDHDAAYQRIRFEKEARVAVARYLAGAD